jgi:hypothetical protein
LLIIIYSTTVRVNVHFRRVGSNDIVETEVSAWSGLIHLKSKVPILHFSEDLSGTDVTVELESPSEPLDQAKSKITPRELWRTLHRIHAFVKKVHELHLIAKRFLKKIRLDHLHWSTTIGTGDAAETGTLIGFSWGIKSNIVGILSAYLTLRDFPKLSVTPDFNKKRLETELRCIIRFRIGHAMIAGIRIILNLRKRRDEKWQSTQFRV